MSQTAKNFFFFLMILFMGAIFEHEAETVDEDYLEGFLFICFIILTCIGIIGCVVVVIWPD